MFSCCCCKTGLTSPSTSNTTVVVDVLSSKIQIPKEIIRIIEEYAIDTILGSLFGAVEQLPSYLRNHITYIQEPASGMLVTYLFDTTSELCQSKIIRLQNDSVYMLYNFKTRYQMAITHNLRAVNDHNVS